MIFIIVSSFPSCQLFLKYFSGLQIALNCSQNQCEMIKVIFKNPVIIKEWKPEIECSQGARALFFHCFCCVAFIKTNKKRCYAWKRRNLEAGSEVQWSYLYQDVSICECVLCSGEDTSCQAACGYVCVYRPPESSPLHR